MTVAAQAATCDRPLNKGMERTIDTPMTPYQSLSYVSEMLVALLRNWRAAAIDHREPTISQEAIPTGRQEVSKANRWLVLQYHPTEQKPLESVQIIFTLLNTKLWICRIYTQPRLNHAATTLARHPPFLWKVLDLYCWRRPDIVKATCKFPVQLYIGVPSLKTQICLQRSSECSAGIESKFKRNSQHEYRPRERDQS